MFFLSLQSRRTHQPPQVTLPYQPPDVCAVESEDEDDNDKDVDVDDDDIDEDGDDIDGDGDEDDGDEDGNGNPDDNSDTDSGAVQLMHSITAIIFLVSMTTLL